MRKILCLFLILVSFCQGKTTSLLKSDPITVEVDASEKIDLSYEGSLAPLLPYPPAPVLTTQNDKICPIEMIEKQLNAKRFPIFYILFFMLLTALIGFYNYKPKLFKIKKRINYQKQAINQLKKLKKTDKTEYYNELIRIIRDAIEKRYGLKTTSATKEELLQLISKKNFFDEGDFSLLETLLKEADLVKFAHHMPSQDEIENAYRLAGELIEKIYTLTKRQSWK